jgi:hypothetical protein
MRVLLTLIVLAGFCSAQKVSTQELIRMARLHAPGLEPALRDTLCADKIEKGTAAAGEMGDFVWAVAAEKGPSLQINHEAPMPAFKAGSLWVVQSRLNTGTSCRYTWLVDGKLIGGANNLAAFGPDSYPQLGAPQGKLTGPIEVPGTIYPGVKACGSMFLPNGMA